MTRLALASVVVLTMGIFSPARAQLALPRIPPLPAFPELPELPLPNPCGVSEASGCFDPVTNPSGGVICHCPPTPEEMERIQAMAGCETVDQAVCISNFLYNPAVVTAQANGAGVAWINLEQCPSNDFPPEAVVAGTLGVGCDTHHEVLTFPEIPGAASDTLAFEDICSPYPGCPATSPAGLFPIDASPCGEEETNVRCHTFEQPGLQHYTCETNPVHTLFLNGLLIVQP